MGRFRICGTNELGDCRGIGLTAIYAVWNNYGFSLASDSNQTATQKGQTWVDPVEKIILLKDHQVAIGAAGNAMHENIEINEIIRSWEKQLPTDSYPQLEDYFIDFAVWYAKQEFNFSHTDIEDIREYSLSRFKSFHEEYSKQISQGVVDALLDKFFEDENMDRTSLNIFGLGWSDFSSEAELEVTEPPTLLTEKIQNVQNLREKLWQNLQEVSSPVNFKNSFHIIDHPDFESTILPVVLESFLEVFGRDFDETIEMDQTLVTFIFSLLENDLEFDLPVKIFFIGYGNDDWLPSGISFELASSFYSVPRIKVSDYSSPKYNWYVALAVDSAVMQLTRGHSQKRHEEILAMAEEHIVPGHEDQFAIDLIEIANNQFHESVRRLDFFTLERLEFVSRLFVQIEALKSYLDEPVQGVGGDTKVITLTKTTRRVNLYKELS